MSTYPNLNEPELLKKINSKDDQSNKLQYKIEKRDHENLLESLKIHNEHYKKKYKSLKSQKFLLIVSEILIVSGSAISTSTMSIINPSIGIVLTIPSALLTSPAIVMTNEFKSKLKLRYTELRELDKFYYKSI